MPFLPSFLSLSSPFTFLFFPFALACTPAMVIYFPIKISMLAFILIPSHLPPPHHLTITQPRELDNLPATANCVFSTLILGEKKYSPPCGMTHSVGSVVSWSWFWGSSPMVWRGPSVICCPMIGSNPASMVAPVAVTFLGGKVVAFAQPVCGD